MMVQPTVSSMMAEASSVIPTLRRMNFISRTTVATILTEATESAVPRNNAVISRCSGCGRMESGRKKRPSATPSAKGTTIPAVDTLMAARLAFLTSLRSVSMPVSSRQHRGSRDRKPPRASLFVRVLRETAPAVPPAKCPEHRRSEQDAGEQLAHHRRLADPLHGFAKQAADQQQQDDLRDEEWL